MNLCSDYCSLMLLAGAGYVVNVCIVCRLVGSHFAELHVM